MIELISNNVILTSLFFSIIINAIFFTVALIFKTDKVTDLSYSLTFAILAPTLLIASGKGYNVTQLLLTIAIFIWAFRLGYYLLKRILITKTDDRFDDKRNNPFNLTMFWLLQITAVFTIMLPSTIYLSSRDIEPQLLPTIIGFLIYLAGFAVESISDKQKFYFKMNVNNKGKWMNEGLWKYSRHPNYFGEILVWWGLFIVVLPTLSGWFYLTVIGPIFITILLLFVSGIPLLEKSAEKKYGDNPQYKEYVRTTNLLIPGPLKKAGG